MAWSKDNGSQSAVNAAQYIDGKKPLIEQAIVDANEAKPIAVSAKAESGQAKVTAGQADTKATDALAKATSAKSTAETVQGEFDRVVAEAGSNNPEVVQARGSEATLKARLDKTTAQLADTNSQVINIESTKANKAEVDSLKNFKADISYVNQQVQAVNNAYKESYATLTNLQTAYPTGDTYNHIVSADGYIYTYFNNSWVSTGVKPANASIDKDSVKPVNVSFIEGQNLFNGYGEIGISSGVVSTISGLIASVIEVKNGKTYNIKVKGIHNRWSIGFADSLVNGSPVESVITNGAGTYTDSTYTVTNTNNKKYLIIVLAYAYSNFQATLSVTDSDTLKIGKTEVVKKEANVVTESMMQDNSVTNPKLKDGIVNSKKLSHMYDYQRILTSADDLNADLPNGKYLIQNTSIPTNCPFNETCILFHENYYFSNYAVQHLISYNDVKKQRIRHVQGGVGTWVNQFEKQLEGKMILTIGDSITAPNKYQTQIASITGATIINNAFDGAKYTMRTNHEPWNSHSFWYLSQYVDLTNIDILWVAFGTNDFSNGVPIGDMTTNEYTLKGSMVKGLTNFLTRKPTLKILVSLPIYRATVDGTTYADIDTTPNFNGGYMESYVDAIVEVCEKYRIPYFNGWRECGINNLNYPTYLSDMLHPTNAGYELIGKKFAHFIEQHN